MAGETLPVFDRRITVRTVTPSAGHQNDQGFYVIDTPEVQHNRKVGASLRSAPITYDDPLRYADVEIVDLLIRDGTTGRAIFAEWQSAPSSARMMLAGRGYLVQGMAEAPEYGRRRVLRLTGRFNIQ